MRYLIIILFILCFSSIGTGYALDLPYSQKLIGFGVLGLFLVAFPVFAYHRWKDRDIKDYMLTQENLDKMREKEGDKRG